MDTTWVVAVKMIIGYPGQRKHLAIMKHAKIRKQPWESRLAITIMQHAL